MPVLVRPATDADASAITYVLVAAFGDEGPLLDGLVRALRTHPCGRDGLEFVAVDDAGVLGHTMVTRSRLDALPRTIDVAVLSPLSVDPRAQRQGVGRALVATAVEAAERAGLPIIFLEGDPGYYSRLGWLPGGPLGFRKPSLRIPDAAFQCIPLEGYESWMRGTLVYAEPFWDFDAVGLRGQALVEAEARLDAEGR